MREKIVKKKIMFVLPFLAVLIVLVGYMSIELLYAPQIHADPGTYIVTNTNDSGTGSFRQAIIDANSNATADETNTIEFNIPGNQVHKITLESALPDIDGSVNIDGYSQPGTSANSEPSPKPLNSVIKIEIDFNGVTDFGLAFIHSGVLESHFESVVSGLSMYGATDALIMDTDGFYTQQYHYVNVEGNYLNTDASGLVMPNQGSETLDQSAVYGSISTGFSEALRVGGSQPEQRNIITGNGHNGHAAVYSLGSQGLFVYGNYIGIGRDGVTDLGGSVGVEMIGINNKVGGSEPGQRNVISGNDLVGVVITDGWDSFIVNNYIGTDWRGEVNPGITNGIGVLLTYSANTNIVGGDEPGEGNLIAGVSGAGISTVLHSYGENSLTPHNNAFIGNTIHSIGTFNFPGFGTSNLAIDLNGPNNDENQGPNPNDPGDADLGPNNLINTPELKTAQQIGNQLTVDYDLDVEASDSPTEEFRIEFYANDESTIFGSGPAQELVGVVDSTGVGTGKQSVFTVDGNYSNKSLSATVTSVLLGNITEYGSTSEMSPNISIGSEDDFDSDGSPDDVEEQGPNDGDANNDGIADRLQPTTTTYEIDSTGIYATFITEGCSENGTVASIDASSLPEQDTDYDYPFGLTDFTLNCSKGDTVTITKYIWDDVDANDYQIRKFNPETNQYIEVADYESANSSVTNETVAGTTGLKLTYSITDGGELDDDTTANGIIVDPVGLAVLAATDPGDGDGDGNGDPDDGNNGGNGGQGPGTNNGNGDQSGKGGNNHLAETGAGIFGILAIAFFALAGSRFAAQRIKK